MVGWYSHLTGCATSIALNPFGMSRTQKILNYQNCKLLSRIIVLLNVLIKRIDISRNLNPNWNNCKLLSSANRTIKTNNYIDNEGTLSLPNFPLNDTDKTIDIEYLEVQEKERERAAVERTATTSSPDMVTRVQCQPPIIPSDYNANQDYTNKPRSPKNHHIDQNPSIVTLDERQHDPKNSKHKCHCLNATGRNTIWALTSQPFATTAKKLTEEQKPNFSQTLLRDDVIEYWQTPKVLAETTMFSVQKRKCQIWIERSIEVQFLYTPIKLDHGIIN